METRLAREYQVCHFVTDIVEEKFSEQELVRKAQNGDKNVFKELVERNERRVVATVISMMGKVTYIRRIVAES